MKPRVLIIQGILPHYRIPFFDGLARCGFDLVVAHSGEPACQLGLSFEELTVRKRTFGPVVFPRGLASVARGFQCVVLPLNPKLGGVLMLSRAVPASRQVLWGHGLARNPVLNRVRLQMARRAGAVVLYDRSGIEGLLAGGVDEAVISVAPNTVSVSNAGVDADVKRTQFLFVGRLQSRKGIEEAFRAFEALVPHIAEDIRFKVIGTGEHGAALRDHARRSGISDRIEFVPATTNSTYLKTEFQRSLAYVSPAHVGLGVLHSFAYGVPVITAAQAAHAPEFYNIVHNTNGLLVGPRVEDLMEAMRTVANSPAHSIELGRRGFELYIKHRRMDQMVGAMRDVISKTIDNDKRQSEVILRKAS